MHRVPYRQPKKPDAAVTGSWERAETEGDRNPLMVLIIVLVVIYWNRGHYEYCCCQSSSTLMAIIISSVIDIISVIYIISVLDIGMISIITISNNYIPCKIILIIICNNCIMRNKIIFYGIMLYYA